MLNVVDWGLVRRVSPPADFFLVCQRLKEIHKSLGQERFRELSENQSTKDTRRQLEALQRDLKSVKTRAWSSLRRAYVAVLQEDPLFSLLEDGRRLAEMSKHFDGYWLMVKTVDRAIADLHGRKRGDPGRLCRSGRQAARELVELYCQSHGAPKPRWDVADEQVRDPAALIFALDCLSTWKLEGAAGLEPQDIIRSL